MGIPLPRSGKTITSRVVITLPLHGNVESVRWCGSEMLKFMRKTLQKSVCRVGIVIGKGK